MPPVLKAKDDTQHQERLSALREKMRAGRRVKNLTRETSKKKFAELTQKEKDDLLKAVAIHLGFLKAD
jgi:hypothetical protein